jgi:uncharacterized protein
LPPFPFVNFATLIAEYETGYKQEDVNIMNYIGLISPRPVFILQGGQDQYVYPDAGEKLFNASGEPKELWFEAEQEHVFFDRDYPEEFERRVVGFFDRYVLADH